MRSNRATQTNNMNCENCLREHGGNYGSGRFCTIKCARGFSTKFKRKEINEKVSKTLKREQKFKILTCKRCNRLFQRHKIQTFCSKKCKKEHPISEETRQKQSKKRCESLQNGNGVKAKKCVFEFQDSKIRCDSLIEFACLDWFTKTFDVKSIIRCNFSILYQACDSKQRRYIPDFIIETFDRKFLVECKGYISVKSVNEKWRKYNENAILKKNVLLEYCKTSNLEAFWFTKDIHIKFYNSLLGSSCGRADGCGKLSTQSV